MMTPVRYISLLLFSSLLVLLLLVCPANSGCTAEDSRLIDLTDRIGKSTGREKTTALLNRAEAYKQCGHYSRAGADYSKALGLAEKNMEHELQVSISQQLGRIYLLEGQGAKAEDLLSTSLELALQLQRLDLAATGADLLGDLLFQEKRREEAFIRYQQALSYANKGEDANITARIHLHIARLLEQNTQVLQHLQLAFAAGEASSINKEKTRLLLDIAAEAGHKGLGHQGYGLRYAALSQALDLAVQQKNERLHSLAAGGLGTLYEENNRLAEAEILTAEAMEMAQQLDSHDLLIQWEWQWARLARTMDRPAEAIAAYRRAVFHIQSIRRDIPIEYQDGRSSFRETLEPIYLGLADLLLQQAAGETGEEKRQLLLREAQETVEILKESELRDYFHDACIVSHSQEIETLSKGTAVVYPIILDDRLEVLVDIGGRLSRQSSNIKREDFEGMVSSLASQLRRNSDLTVLQPLSREIYSQLFQPISPLLESQGVDTLVFVPDGVLRLLPIAALWNGNHFLLEDYAVATVPGLTLLDPNPLKREELLTLLAGVSSPGPVVSDLPKPLLKALRQISPESVNREMRGFSVTVAEPVDSGKDQKDDIHQDDLSQIKDTLALPGVTREIEQIALALPSQVLLDENFKLERFASELKSTSYRMVHIASHGFFGGKPEDNFIMAYDRVLNMNYLEELIKPKQFAELPVELVALSACQTAEGDDRSPLGLTGVALKSGARSAMGSLWPVADQAAQKLLTSFYANLKDSTISKAQSLRKAQLQLLQQDQFHHPFYWSPFILVGNWL